MALKRSRQLALTTLMAAAAVNLTACGDQPPSEALTWDDTFQQTADAGGDVDALAYDNVDACKTADEIPDAECDSSWLAAQNEHVANGPKFGDKAACEAEYGEGNCETRTSSGGGSFFMPFLAGMVVSNMMNPGRGSYYRGAGLYRDRYGRLNTPYGGSAGGLYRDPMTGRTRIPRSSIEPPAAARYAPPASARAAPSPRSRVVSRGGFRSSGRSGFGG
jgi:uncharacterized protein YgiB involved in biofilm formation